MTGAWKSFDDLGETVDRFLKAGVVAVNEHQGAPLGCRRDADMETLQRLLQIDAVGPQSDKILCRIARSLLGPLDLADWRAASGGTETSMSAKRRPCARSPLNMIAGLGSSPRVVATNISTLVAPGAVTETGNEIALGPSGAGHQSKNEGGRRHKSRSPFHARPSRRVGLQIRLAHFLSETLARSPPPE